VAVTAGGTTKWVYQYEATHPDATATAVGTNTARACANVGVQPWSPVTWTQAQAACAAVKDSTGAALHLCDEVVWQQACSLGNTAASVWSYATNPTTYQSTVCNGADAGVGKPWATGAGTSCYAADANGHIYDLSGNVAEWTSTQVLYNGVTYYRVRGGAYNNPATGISCNFDFVIEQPTYEYTDVGFRCCADNPP
jgi:formylglycine-generating enzyme required for sulfatase activity